MKEQYRKHNIFLMVYILAVALWLVSVMIKASRTEGDQIIFNDGEYYDCTEGWYDDEGNVYNIENVVFTKDDVSK